MIVLLPAAGCAKPWAMSDQSGFAGEVRRVTTAVVQAGGGARIEDVAASLFMSRSTLQRRLAAQDTSFTEIRCQARVKVALAQLTSGASCASAARSVGLTGEHLCKLMIARIGLRPLEVARAARLSARARRWRRSTPPRSGTRLYRDRIIRWQALEAEVLALLAPIPSAGHPLSAWARRTRRVTARPDYRSGKFRTRVRAARRKERKKREAARREINAWWARFQREMDLQESAWPDDLDSGLVSSSATSVPDRSMVEDRVGAT